MIETHVVTLEHTTFQRDKTGGSTKQRKRGEDGVDVHNEGSRCIQEGDAHIFKAAPSRHTSRQAVNHPGHSVALITAKLPVSFNCYT